MNEPLLMDFRQGIEEMRARTLSDRRYYSMSFSPSPRPRQSLDKNISLKCWPDA